MLRDQITKGVDSPGIAHVKGEEKTEFGSFGGGVRVDDFAGLIIRGAGNIQGYQ